MTSITAPLELHTGLAGPTGGEAFLNNNDLLRDVRKAYRDASRYYVLGYVPDRERKPEAIHRIKVKLPDGIRARYRDMYIEQTQLDRYRLSVNAALAFPRWFDDFPFRVELSEENEELAVRTLVPVSCT